MTTETQPGRQVWLPTLVGVLLVAVLVQAFFLVKLYRQSDVEKALDARARSERTIQPTPRHRSSPPPSAGPTLPSWWDDWWEDVSEAWDPFAEMERMRERMSRLWDDMFNRFKRSPLFDTWGLAQPFSLNMDLTDEGDRYVVRFDMPGMDEGSISVQLDDRLLTVSGESSSQKEQKEGGRVLRLERRTGRFQRSLTLPGPVESDKMEARYEKGVLIVTVPKAAGTAPKRSLRIT